jgi:hypothetical protein
MLLNEKHSIILGPPSTGKTSIAFRKALISCTHHHDHVIFITTEERAKRRCPLEITSLSFSNTSQMTQLNNIHMKYFDSNQGSEPIIRYLSHFHLLSRQPNLIIIDDVSIFCPTFEEKFRLSSLLEKVCMHANILHEWTSNTTQQNINTRKEENSNILENIRHCRIIITDTLNEVGEYPDIKAFSNMIKYRTEQISTNSFQVEKMNGGAIFKYKIMNGTMIQVDD